MKNKKLVPVYEDWQVDETMLFYEEDVEKLIEQRPKGYTTSEVAKILGVHQTTISKQIKEGKIPADMTRYRGRMTYFVQEEALEELERTQYPNHRAKSFFYHPKFEYYLFQSFLNEKTREKARIIELTNEGGTVLTDNGEQFAIDDLTMKGFIPQQRFAVQKTINKPGFVTFRFQQPSSLHSFTYEVIESFYRALSHKNMKIYQSNGYIEVHVKPFLLKQNGEYFSLLENHIVEGEVTKRHNGILLDSLIERLTIYPTSKQKEQIYQLANEKKVAVNDLVIKIIEDFLTKTD